SKNPAPVYICLNSCPASPYDKSCPPPPTCTGLLGPPEGETERSRDVGGLQEMRMEGGRKREPMIANQHVA
ncbi:5'-3' exonuclease PLD3, partial [Dissostichus eleginoides]